MYQKYCADFDLPDVTLHYIPHDMMRKKIEIKTLDRLWVDHLIAKKPPPMVRRTDCTMRYYSNLPKHKAKLALLMEVGELNFRKNRKYEAMKKYGSIQCLEPTCREDDTLAHANECFGYQTRLKEEAGPYEIIDYLVELDCERMRKYHRSLLNHRVL